MEYPNQARQTAVSVHTGSQWRSRGIATAFRIEFHMFPFGMSNEEDDMSHYGISAVRVDPQSNEIAEAVVHKFAREENNPGKIGLDEGCAMLYHDIATLIDAGNSVYVLTYDGPGAFRHGDKVRIKQGCGPFEYIESCGDTGQATQSLFELPHFG